MRDMFGKPFAVQSLVVGQSLLTGIRRVFFVGLDSRGQERRYLAQELKADNELEERGLCMWFNTVDDKALMIFKLTLEMHKV